MDTLNNIVLEIQHYLSDYILIVALGFGGIWFSFRTGFIQVRGFKEGMRRTFGATAKLLWRKSTRRSEKTAL